MKKILTALLITAATLSMATTAFAHGGRQYDHRHDENGVCGYGYDCPDHEDCPRDDTCQYYQDCADNGNCLYNSNSSVQPRSSTGAGHNRGRGCCR